ncbi:MAG: DNA repair protein RecO [Planctomycetota bacterium]|nr:DNA repair protein RecO [Planctomycetota bacterium]
MPGVLDNAIVLRVWDYSETSQTASLLSREHGVVRVLAKGARRPASKFGGGLEPVTLGEASLIIKPATELASLIEWDLREIFWPVRRELRCHYAGLYIADLLHHTVLAGDAHPRLFDATLEALRRLTPGEPVEGPLLLLQWDLLTEIGYRPRLAPPDASTSGASDASAAPGADRAGRPSASTVRFDPTAGGVISDDDAHAPGASWQVRRDTVDVLARLDSERAAALDAGNPSVVRASRLLAAYLRSVMDRELPTRHLVFGPQGPRKTR